MNDTPIEFKLSGEPYSEVTVDYLPYGTKTLKIETSVPEGQPPSPALRLSPENMSSTLIAGHEDNGQELLVHWGGGHEEGPCAHSEGTTGDKCLEVGHEDSGTGSGLSYLNVTHRETSRPTDGKLKDYVLTVRTVKANATEDSRPVSHASLRINLRVPRLIGSSDPVTDPVLPVWHRQGAEGEIRFEGSEVPLYITRWWPIQQVVYWPLGDESSQLAAIRQLRITFRKPTRPGLGGKRGGQVHVFLDQKLLMNIDGDLGPHLFDERLFHPEVYRFFDERFIVLRLWFHWLAKEQTVRGHEVPDAERFDLLIDTQKQTVEYMATDMHWRELWGKQEGLVESHIGLNIWRAVRMSFIWAQVRLQRRKTSVELKHYPAYHLCRELTGGEPFYERDVSLVLKGGEPGRLELMRPDWGERTVVPHYHVPCPSATWQLGERQLISGDVRES